MDLVERSEELHAAARRPRRSERFRTARARRRGVSGALLEGLPRLVRSRRAALDDLASIPAVPTDAFKVTRVAVHPPELDVVSFHTSGTTAEARGTHHFRTLETYHSQSLAFGRRALASDREGPRTVACLAPALGAPPTSSLGMMMRYFADAWDPHTPASERWLVDNGDVNLAGLERAAIGASHRGEPFVLLATAFALVALLDRLQGRSVAAPAESVVMVTGVSRVEPVRSPPIA